MKSLQPITQSFISDNFLHTHGEHGPIGNFLGEGNDTLRIKDEGSHKIASSEHLAEYKNQIVGITKIPGGFVLLRYTGKTSNIVSNMDILRENKIETVVSLNNLRESFAFMAEFMPGFINTPNMKRDTLENHLSQYFDIKISNDSSESFTLLQREYPDEVKKILSQIAAKKNPEILTGTELT